MFPDIHSCVSPLQSRFNCAVLRRDACPPGPSLSPAKLHGAESQADDNPQNEIFKSSFIHARCLLFCFVLLYFHPSLTPISFITIPQVMTIIFCFFFFNFYLCYLFIWLCWVFVSVRGLSLVAASGGHSSSRCAGLSLSRPLLLQSTGSRHAGSVVVAHGPSCSAACGIFPEQGLNPCPLHWQADSQPLHHQGSPYHILLCM